MKKKTKCNLVSIVCFKLVSGQKESKKFIIILVVYINIVVFQDYLINFEYIHKIKKNRRCIEGEKIYLLVLFYIILNY